jgi:hypothetical protein
MVVLVSFLFALSDFFHSKLFTAPASVFLAHRAHFASPSHKNDRAVAYRAVAPSHIARRRISRRQ